jgi:hypothetical protein
MATNPSFDVTPTESMADSRSSRGSPVLIVGPSEANPASASEIQSYSTAAELQKWWREGTGAPLYQAVAVLMIHWKLELDDLKCAEEVSEQLYAIGLQ